MLVRCRVMRLLVVLMLVLPGLTQAQVVEDLIQDDFQTCSYQPWVTIPSNSTQGLIQGNFPQDWSENSSWSSISYTSMQINDGIDTFWRLNVPVAETGWVQILKSLPTLIGGTSKHYKLIIVARGNEFITARIRQNGSPYLTLWSYDQELTSTWQTFQLDFDIRETLPNEVSFFLNLPSLPCQVDIKSIQLLENEIPVFETNFQTCTYGDWVTIPSQSTQGIIHGNFPGNWSDNSSWSSISYTSTYQDDGTDTFWRVDNPLAESGVIQLRHALPTQLGGNLYRYAVTFEGRGNVPLTLIVRQNGAPYQALWQAEMSLTSSWQTYQYEFVLQETLPNQVSFFMKIDQSPCLVDFRNIQFQKINQSVLNSDFSTCNYGSWVTIQSQSTLGVIEGNFPENWTDNSSWDLTSYLSKQEQEGTDLFWRLSSIVNDTGKIQLRHGLPSVLGGQNCRYVLKLTIRGDQTIQTGIRQSGAPYQFLWSATKQLSTEWQTLEWEFDLRQTEPNEVAFWLNISGIPSQVDIKDIQLVEMNPQLIDDNLKFVYQGSGPDNLLRQSRLPLGLPNGWSLFREFDDMEDVTILSVFDINSPSGSDVLCIDSPNKEIVLYGEPIRVDRTWLTHTASLYAKGDGELKIYVYNATSCLGQMTITLNNQTQWTRYYLNFTPISSDHATHLRFVGQGIFKIDGLMVHSGETVKPYQSQLAAEVALGPGDGEIAGFARCHFDNELYKKVNYVVTGVPNGIDAVLKIKMFNVYGEEYELSPITLSNQTQCQGDIDYNVFPDRPYGSVRIEAHVEDSQGQQISAFNELVMHHLRRPKYWMIDAPDSPFGIHTLATRRHIQMAKAVGINWTRLHDAGTEYIGWYHLENQPGHWVFCDAELNRYRQYGMKILGALSTAPTWASYYPGYYTSSYYDRYFMPLDFNQFASQYVSTVVSRYANVIDDWDLWNEPWGTWWAVDYDPVTKQYIPPSNEVQTFADFQKTVYPALKLANPNANLIGFNSYIGSLGNAWTSGMIQNGATPYADVFSYHHYTSSNIGYPDDVLKQALHEHAGQFSNQQLPYPAWMTEGSPTSQLIDSGFYNHTLSHPSDEDVNQTADRVGRFCLSLLTAGVEKFFMYSMGNNNYFDMCNGHQTLMTEEGYLHPSADAMSAFAYFIEDKTFASYQLLAPCVHSYQFNGMTQNVAVLVTSPGPRANYYLPNTPNVFYYDFYGNPLNPGDLLGDTLVFAVSDN